MVKKNEKINLTKKDINKIYDYWKDKKLDLKEMISMYCSDPSNYIHFKIHIEFKRGSDYDHEGLLTKNEYNYVMENFDNGFELHLGEINGKHSSASADRTDFTFSIGDEIVEKYIVENGIYTDICYFSGRFEEENYYDEDKIYTENDESSEDSD